MRGLSARGGDIIIGTAGIVAVRGLSARGGLIRGLIGGLDIPVGLHPAPY